MQRRMMYGILFRFSGTPNPINTCSRVALNHILTRLRHPPPITDVPARGDARFMRRPRSIHSIKCSLADVLLVNGSSANPFITPPPVPRSPPNHEPRPAARPLWRQHCTSYSRCRMCVNKRAVYT